MADQLVFNDSVNLLGILATGLTSLQGTIEVTYGTTNTVTGSLTLEAVGLLAAQTYTNLNVTQTGVLNDEPVYTLTGTTGLTQLSITYIGQLPSANSVVVSTLLGITAGSGSGNVQSTGGGSGDHVPTVVAETGSVVAGQVTSVSTANGALKGDSDPNGGTLSITSVSHGGTTDAIGPGGSATIAGAYGTLTMNADGAYSYAATNGLRIVTAANGSPIVDTFGDTVSASGGTSSPSSLAITVSLAAGGTETVSNASGSATYTIGATTLTLNETSASVYSGAIQDGSSGNVGGNVVVVGSAPLILTGVSTYTGQTSISGTLALAGSASIHGSSKVSLTGSGATLDISGATAGEVVNNLAGVAGSTVDLGNQNLKVKVQTGIVDTFSGVIRDGGLLGTTGGSLELGGLGELILTGVEAYTGATKLDAGTLALTGSGSIAASSGLTLAAGATFDISGETHANIGTLSGAAGSVVDLGSGALSIDEKAATTFAGVLQDGGAMGGGGGSLVVGGTAALTLTSVSAYTGKTSVAGTLDLAGAGAIQRSTKVALTTAGATLDISGASGRVVVNKLGGVAGTVTDLGANDLKIKVQTGITDTYSGTIGDGGVAGGRGGSVELGGLGTLILAHANTYTGGTRLDAGTLDIAAAGAAGTGTIAFTNPTYAATLEIEAAALTATGANTYDFGNQIEGASSTSQMIDLRGLAYVQGSTSATLSGTTLSVNDGTSAVTLHLAGAQSKSSFTTASDGSGGTLVYDPPSTAVTPGAAASAKVDPHWIEIAMADFGDGVTGNAHGHTTSHDPYGLAASADVVGHGLGGHHFHK